VIAHPELMKNLVGTIQFLEASDFIQVRLNISIEHYLAWVLASPWEQAQARNACIISTLDVG
jgi:hypothetical protein